MAENASEEKRKVNPDCRNAWNRYHECSDYCFKISADKTKKITNRTNSGRVIRPSLVQKALKDMKQKLIARSRASFFELHPDATSAPVNPCMVDDDDLPTLVYSVHERGEPSHRSSKDKPKTPFNESGKRIRKDEEPGPTKLEEALKQLEMQRKAVEDHRAELSAQEPCRDFSGDCIVPNWNISSQSSVLNTRAGEDSFELYRACVLPLDQVALAPMAPCKLEENAAHDLMRVAAVTHQLTLQCTTLQKDQKELSKKVAKLEGEKRELVRLVYNLKDWTKNAEDTLMNAHIEIKRLEQVCADSFNAGRAAGGREFAETEEYQAALREARLSGAKDFKKSPTFEHILASKAAEYEMIGFIKCQKQILKLGGFKPGFDRRLLDSSKDGNLKSPSIDDDASQTDDSEFGILAED